MENEKLEQRQQITTKLPWIMQQTWNDILFAHYPVQHHILEKLVPSSLSVDRYNGVSWVSIVPYFTTSMHVRGLPPFPGLSAFPGFNVRTYVTVDGKPGVYFFKLTAAHVLAAYAAKTFFCLPYTYMKMEHRKTKDLNVFESEKKYGLQLLCNYQAISAASPTEAGSLEEWLVERYCLYTVSKKGIIFRGDILHEPWDIEKAEAEFHQNTALSSLHIMPENQKPILHYAKRKVVRFWPIVPIRK